MLDNVLLTFALEQESQNIFRDFSVLYTGVGKINATWSLSQYIHEEKPCAIINLGTAGSKIFEPESIVHSRQFIQRDMDVTPLGFEKGQTPFSNEPIILKYGQAVESIPHAICGTGDNFEIAHNNNSYDIIDMEAYALARVCQNKKIPFTCIKYISDSADGKASNDWNESLKKTAISLREMLEVIQQSRTTSY